MQDFNIEINLSELDDFKGGFDLKHLRIKNMHKEKVLMCGDAANTFHPMAGQSLNLGIGDTINIHDNLDKILSGNESSYYQYNKIRNNKNIQMTWIIQSLHGAFGNASYLQDFLLGNGMKILNQHTKIKEKIIEYANKN